MANRWNIPPELELLVRDRDRACVYCRHTFTAPPASRSLAPSWEHIINDATIITPENIALCCVGCNASKGQKTLREWLESDYCKRKGISAETVAPVVRAANSITQK